jgi:hypothetical protein
VEVQRRRQQEIRAAMLSVYYHSIGSRLELHGAPAVLMPLDTEPMSLEAALAVLKQTPRFNQAVWTLARAVAPVPPGEAGVRLTHRYPSALLRVVSPDTRAQLERFDRLRTDYRRAAQVYAAVLITFAQSVEGTKLEHIRKLFGLPSFKPPSRMAGFDIGAGRHLGSSSFSEYMESELGAADDQPAARKQLQKLEQELGVSLATYVQEFADAVAFAEVFGEVSGEEVSVFPTSSVTIQDAHTLQTTVTVTALVVAEHFDCLQISTDPQCWRLCSDAFHTSQYVKGSYDLTPLPRTPGSYAGPRRHFVLEEDVRLTWGEDATERGGFHNLLNVGVSYIGESIDIEFDLNRSITSRILWDERPGGILVDEGTLKVRPLTGRVWRITARKALRFSDRTPYSGGAGWNDLGQMLNYLAPATLSWWIESEMYSATCQKVVDEARRQRSERTPVAESEE